MGLCPTSQAPRLPRVLKQMKTLLTTAAFVLIASITTAQAAPKIPNAFHGNWCATNVEPVHVPGHDCDPVDHITIGPTVLAEHESKCVLQAVRFSKLHNAQTYRFECRGAKWPDSDKTPSTMFGWISRHEGKLFLSKAID